jgi:hypothetical protein
LGSLRTLRTSRTLGTRYTLRTSGAGCAGRTRRTLGTLGTLRSGVTRSALGTSCAGRADWTRWAGCSLRTRRPLRTCRSFRSSRSKDGEIRVIPDHVDDKIRNSERSEKEIAQTFASRCSMSG